MLWRFPLVVALVISLTLAQLLPFLDLVAHAQRATGFADLRWLMPGSGLANFLVPMAFGSTLTEGVFFQHGQYWTSSYYLGLGTLWLALLAPLCLRERRVWLLGKHRNLRTDLCARRKHAGAARVAKSFSAIELHHLPGQICGRGRLRRAAAGGVRPGKL